jgi:hypothetical protein
MPVASSSARVRCASSSLDLRHAARSASDGAGDRGLPKAVRAVLRSVRTPRPPGLIAQPDRRCPRTYCRRPRRSACSDGMRPASPTPRLSGLPELGAIVDHLVVDLRIGRAHSVAFVVASDVTCALPLYDVAIATARRGWRLGIPDALYWFVTPEPAPLARYGTAVSAAVHQRLEPEGITFIGSTYAEVRRGVVLLDPQGGCIEPDRTVTLHRGAEGLRPDVAGRGTLPGWTTPLYRDFHLHLSDSPSFAAEQLGEDGGARTARSALGATRA